MTHPNTIKRFQDVLDRLEAGGTYQEERGTLIDIYYGLNARMLLESEEAPDDAPNTARSEAMALYVQLLDAAAAMCDSYNMGDWPAGAVSRHEDGSPWMLPRFENGQLTLTFECRQWQALTGFSG